jgi:hypothetical protein
LKLRYELEISKSGSDEEESELSDSEQDGAQRKSYDKMAKESKVHEDLEYMKLKNKRLNHLGRRGKHMLMYSNINQMNFVDIN